MYLLVMGAPTQPKKRLTPTHWTDAAMTLLAESGIGAVTMDRLAERLGVTRGSFYHHFANRESLLKAVETLRDNYQDYGCAIALPVSADTALTLARITQHPRPS